MGITFNGVHSSTFGLETKTYRPLHPGRDDNYVDTPGRAGSIPFPGKPQDRIILVEFGFMPDRAAFRETVWAVSAWLDTDGKAPLIIDDEPDKT